MIYELLYTSAPAGLRPGSSGYCTVQSSRGIPAPTVDLLESLSGYRHVYTAGTPDAVHNPVNFGHYMLRVQGRAQHVLSRVSDCPLDHTGRSNKIGHHMVIDDPDGIPGGPAWLMQQPGWMIDRWDGQVTTLNTVRKAPAGKRPAGICTRWKQTTGDAGWAGVLAEAFQKNPDRKVFVIYKPGTDLLALFEEALALLPASRRWDVTFSTYGAALPATVDCIWNGVIAGSQEEHLSKRFVNALRIDLTKPPGPAPDAGPLVDVARTGQLPSQPVAPQQPKHQVPAHATAPPSVSASDVVSDSFSRVADPGAPPPVRRPVQQKSGHTRLILTILACCLLFGGGTAAGVMYFLQKDKPVVLADVAEDDLPQEPTSPEKAAAPVEPPSGQPAETPPPTEVMAAASSESEKSEESSDAKQANEPTTKEDQPVASAAKEAEKLKPERAGKPEVVVREYYATRPLILEQNVTSTVELPAEWADGITEETEISFYVPSLKEHSPETLFRKIEQQIRSPHKCVFVLTSDLIPDVLVEVAYKNSAPYVKVEVKSNLQDFQQAGIRGAAITFRNDNKHTNVFLNAPLRVSKMSIRDDYFVAPILREDVGLQHLVKQIISDEIEYGKSIRLQSDVHVVEFSQSRDGVFLPPPHTSWTWTITPHIAVEVDKKPPYVGTFVPDFGQVDDDLFELGEEISGQTVELNSDYEEIRPQLEGLFGDRWKQAQFKKLVPSFFSEEKSDQQMFSNAVRDIKEAIANLKEQKRRKGNDKDQKKEGVYRKITDFLQRRETLWQMNVDHANMELFKKKMTLTNFDVYYKLYPVYGNDDRELRSLLITTRQDVNAER